MPARLSTKLEKAIVEAYRRGMTHSAAAQAVGVHPATAKATLLRLGIELRPPGAHPRRTPSRIESEIIRAYRAGATLEAAARAHGRCYHTAWRILRRYGEESRASSEYAALPVRHDFFSEIDSAEKAYWLGFLTADGHIDQSKGRISLELAAMDVKHVAAFRSAIGSEHALRVRRRGIKSIAGKALKSEVAQASLTFTSRQMADDLGRLGLHSDKTLTAVPWRGPDALMPHYWRGLVDGDGHVSKSSTSMPDISLCGTQAVIRAFHGFAVSVTGTMAVPRETGPRFWQFNLKGIAAVMLVRTLYQNPKPVLARKARQAKQMIERFRGQRLVLRKWRISEEEKEAIRSLYSQDLSLEKVSKRLGHGVHRVWTVLRESGLMRSRKEAHQVSTRRSPYSRESIAACHPTLANRLMKLKDSQVIGHSTREISTSMLRRRPSQSDLVIVAAILGLKWALAARRGRGPRKWTSTSPNRAGREGPYMSEVLTPAR